MKKKIIIGIIFILLILGFAVYRVIFDQRGQSGSLPKETLLPQKKYVEDYLKKYHYDYKVIVDLDEDGYGLMWVEMYKGNCDVVQLLFSYPQDQIMERTATPHPEVCFYVKK